MSEFNQRNRVFSIKEANTFFIILAILFLTVGSYVQSRELISGLLITEFGLLAIPVIIYSIIKKKDIKTVFRLKSIPISAMLKIIVLALFMLPLVAVANLITIFFIEIFGHPVTSVIPTASNGIEFIVLFAVIAGSAGICEELFFRGVILNGYESETSLKWGAIFSGLLFGIFHFNPQNLFGPIVLGILFSYLVQLTGSIFAGMIAHITNNGIAVAMGYLLNVFGVGSEASLNDGQLLFESTGVILGAMAFYVILGTMFFFGIKAMLKSLRKQFPRMIQKRIVDDDTHEISFQTIEDYSPLWGNEKLLINGAHFFPIGLSIMIYGLVIFLAYF